MTPALQIGLGIAMFLVTLMQLTVLVGFKTGKFIAGADGSTKESDRRLEEHDALLERAGEQSSKLATVVQGLIGRLDRLPQELREMGFVTHDTAELMIEKAVGGRRQRPRDN